MRLALSKGPNWVGVFPLLIWGRKQVQFPKRQVFYFLEYRTMEKSKRTEHSVDTNLVFTNSDNCFFSHYDLDDHIAAISKME
jgi:hypothetical protein